jgi:CRISPR/Cas system CMR subunit Cmr4 (Cas7 group RAMP superfamily)
MTPKLSHFHIARITLETITPLSIAAGDAQGVFDVTLVRDANGLPALPGSSIAGVLRHLFQDIDGSDDAAIRALFGDQVGDSGDPSRLHVSWGAILDSTGQPVEGLLLGKKGRRRLADPLLSTLLDSTRTTRDRVRIDHRGTAAHRGKFDRSVVPAGIRFRAELMLWSEQADDPRWQQVLDLLAHPAFRLGGGTRAGLGRLKVAEIHSASFDLKKDKERKAFATLGRGLGETRGLTPAAVAGDVRHPRYLTARLSLKPRAFWRIGQGEGGDSRNRLDDKKKPADLLPKLEARWDWEQNKAKAAELLIPGTSLKGLLAHRVAFHANRFADCWAEDWLKIHEKFDKSDDCDMVRELFGFARDDRDADDDEAKGQAGRLFIDDAYLEFTEADLQLMMHNAIDRFTGGVREHMLFSEELVWRREIQVELMIDTRDISNPTRKALREALADLCEGRLAIGGGAAKGHGFCDGSIAWNDKGTWIDAPDQTPTRAPANDSAEAA